MTEVASRTTGIRSRLKVFESCGRAAQIILLENGTWTRLYEWMVYAITSKDVSLTTEILECLLSMPTSFSELTGPGGRLSQVVEKLLQRTVLGQADEFGVEESKIVANLSAKVFARWLRLKKRSTEFCNDPERTTFETEAGEIGSIAPLKNTPGYGLLGLNGKVSVVEIAVESVKTPLVSPSHVPSIESFSSQCSNPSPGDENEFANANDKVSSSNVNDPEEMKINLLSSVVEEIMDEDKNLGDGEPNHLKPIVPPKNAPKVFKTSKSRSDNLLQEMLDSQEVIKKFQGNSPPGNADLPKVVDEVEPPVPVIESVKESPPTKKRLLNEPSQHPLENIENYRLLKTIGNDLGEPKKMVTWWGVDGVKNVHRYERDENHKGEGCVKEKWTSISLQISDDEYDDFPDADGLYVDEEQKESANTIGYPPPRRSHDPRRFTIVKEVIPWKLTKILIPPRRYPLQDDSAEKRKQMIRERLVPKAPDNPTPDFHSPSSPIPELTLGFFDYGNDTDEESPPRAIPTEDISGMPDKRDNTKIYDHSQQKWPRQRHRAGKAIKWSPIKFGFVQHHALKKPRA